MARKQWVRQITLVGETYDGNVASSDGHTMDRITEAIAKVNNVNFGIAFFDEKGRRLRKVELNKLGEFSPEMERLVEVELGSDEAVGA